MTNATLPTSHNLSLLGGLLKIYVDQYGSVVPLGATTSSALATINGTNFRELPNGKTGSVFGAVPAATNLRIYGIEVYNPGGTTTLAQIGYDDDGAGTNFTILFDLFATFGIGASVSNIITGLLTVPTGKHIVVKQTATSITNPTYRLIGLLTN